MERLASLARWAIVPLLGCVFVLCVAADVYVATRLGDSFLTPLGDPFLTPLVGMVAAALTLRAVSRGSYLRTALVVASASLLLTWVDARSPSGLELGFSESLSLYVLTLGSVRTAERSWAYVPVLTTVAAVALPRRSVELSAMSPMTVVAVLCVSLAAFVGLYLRFQDHQRRVALTSARQAERLDLARELHDVVGHHLTGIVIRAQAARFTSATGPDDVNETLASIEEAGADALAAIRRMVGGLQEASPVTVAPSLAEVEHLVVELKASHPGALLSVDNELRRNWLAPEIASSAFRVLQESVTNVRKHGDPQAPVWISLSSRDGGMSLEVHNRVTAGRAPSGDGYGLISMAERVNAQGGRFAAGPDGNGNWRVQAFLPLGLRPPRPLLR
ncbi:MAG: histidine kinase [Actinomycetota bacterium]|nr:histidine kinase [Actinomycetota bacterium]